MIYIVTGVGNHLGLWDDLNGQPDVVVKTVTWKKTSFIPRALNVLLNKPFMKNILHTSYELKVNALTDYKIAPPIGSKIYLVNGVIPYVDMEYFLSYKKQGYELNLILIDSMNASSPVLVNSKPYINHDVFEHIYSFDRQDCREYGFEELGCHYYSKRKDIAPDTEHASDIYFTGGLKGGREKMLFDIFDECKKHNVNAHFDVSTFNVAHDAIPEGIDVHTRWISYETVLSRVMSSNCILDVVQNNQHGPSLRYFEAVIYNKKLLSNNPHIAELPFYNPKWMKVFKDIKDIDYGWLSDTETIDYGYHDEFSPIHLLRKIK